MVLSSRVRVSDFKTSPYERCRNLLRSRNTQAARAGRMCADLREARAAISALRSELDYAEHRQQQAELRIRQLEAEKAQLQRARPRLPHDPPLPRHSFGPKMISLCVNLSRIVGLRPVAKILPLVANWLGVEFKIPQWTAVRTWLCRLGIAALTEPYEAADDLIWLADHSNQIGPEKVLAILGIRTRDLPERGQPLRHEDVRCLAVLPGTQWKREDVARAYAALAKRIGKPLAILTDGAVELRESAEVLQSPDENTKKPLIRLGDFKHYAANVLKKALDKDPQFWGFDTKLGRTRSAVQQTELAHFTPPPPKQKARFMNLAATLRWAEMTLWSLEHPQTRACHGIASERLEEKLGWLKSYRPDVARWSRCQDVVSASLSWINEHGVYAGASEALRSELQQKQLGGCHQSGVIAQQLVAFVAAAEAQLDEGTRLPLSTEILESSFGRYKLLEKQHSKGGFTSLLAAFPALLRPCTPEKVREAFARVPVAAVDAWTKTNLGSTLAARRKQAYKDFIAQTPVAV